MLLESGDPSSWPETLIDDYWAVYPIACFLVGGFAADVEITVEAH